MCTTTYLLKIVHEQSEDCSSSANPSREVQFDDREEAIEYVREYYRFYADWLEELSCNDLTEQLATGLKIPIAGNMWDVLYLQDACN